MAFNWTYDPLIAEQTLIHAADYLELQTAVDIIRSKAHKTPITNWYHIEPSRPIRVLETQQIRDAIDDVDPSEAGCTTDNTIDLVGKYDTHRNFNNGADHTAFPGNDDTSLCASDCPSQRIVHKGSVNSSYCSKDDVPWYHNH